MNSENKTKMVSLGRPRVSVTPKSYTAGPKLKINISRLRTHRPSDAQSTDAPHSTRTVASAAQSTPRSPRTPRSSTPGSARQRTPRGTKSNRDNAQIQPSACPEEIQRDEDEDDLQAAEHSWERSSSLIRSDIRKIIEQSRIRTSAGTQVFTELCSLIGSLQVEQSEEHYDESKSASRQRASLSPRSGSTLVHDE
ncbi:Hypothetical protein, putative, partial [Bodo saltans]